MRLKEFFQDYIQTVRQMSSVPEENGEQARLMNQLIRSLTPGQTIQGEILSNQDGQVQIRLDNNLLLQAALEQDMKLEIGNKMTFQVKNTGSKVSLSPLFANTATDDNALKALQMAGIPANEKSVALTKALMSQGLPIDKQNLGQAYRELYQVKGATPEDVVQLHRLGIEVDEESISQLHNYKEMSYQIETAVRQMMDGVVEIADKLIAQGNVKEAAQILEKIVELGQENISKSTADETAQAVKVPETSGAADTTVTDGTALTGVTTMEDGTAKNTIAVRIDSAENKTETLEAPYTLKDSMDSQKTGESKLAEQIIKELLNHEVSPELRTHKKTELKEILTEKWLSATGLSPKDVADKGKITELYNRVEKLIADTQKSISQTEGIKFPEYQTVKEFQQNMDFLHQVNQYCQYVQLPLLLRGESAHGDLYVFSSKRNLASKDGKLSAYLHLDMQNLGSVGVYVTMEEKKVSTRFMLENEESLELIEKNIDSLNSRLNKKGYALTVTTGLDREEKGGIYPILQQKGSEVPIQQLSFDVRA